MKFTYTTVSDRTKLKMLQSHAFGVEWPNLTHKNWCLHCEKEFDGRSVRVLRINGGDFYLECGTPGCDGSPIDWAPYPWWEPEHPASIAYLAAHPEEAQHVIECDHDAEFDEPFLDAPQDPPVLEEPFAPNRLSGLASHIGFSAAPDDSLSGPSKTPMFADYQPGMMSGSRELLPQSLPRFEAGQAPSRASGSTNWELLLAELGSWLSNDQRYECSWDCFLENFAGDSSFLVSSPRVDDPLLMAALEAVLQQAYPDDHSTRQILVLQFGQTDLFHGAIHSGTSLYMFYYLARIDYGFLRTTSTRAGKTNVARFRINQGG